MFQPEPTAYLQVSTGYAIPHGLPDYTFDETPLRLSDGRGSGSTGLGGNSVGALLFGTSIFSANSANVGPAPSASNSFNFHATPSTTTAAANSTISAPSHHRPSLPLLLKMEPNAHDLVAQEAAAREYQIHAQVTHPLCDFALSRPQKTRAHQKPALLFAGSTRRQENAE
jgi:ubiquitin thioesterase protein OTUB1